MIGAVGLLASSCQTTKTAVPAKEVINLSMSATVKASSTSTEWEGEGPVESVIDGISTTRWSSGYSDNQTLTVDLGESRNLTAVKLHWETAAAKRFAVSLSVDGNTWQTLPEQAPSTPGPRMDAVSVTDYKARYVRVDLIERNSDKYGFSLYEVEVLGY
jgi:hypothetical protein